MRRTLASYEQEQGEDLDPFEVEIADGDVVTLRHPQDVPFQDVVNFSTDNPGAVLEVLMGKGAFDRLTGASHPDGRRRVTLRVLGDVLADYMEHYGLPTSPEAVASLRSSTGSARRSKRTSGSRRTAAAS